MAREKQLKTPRKFKLKQVVRKHPVGTIVYELMRNDYGFAAQDSAEGPGQLPCISVTLKEDGDYPYFTCPLKFLEEVKETKNPAQPQAGTGSTGKATTKTSE